MKNQTSPSTTIGSGPVFSKCRTTPLWTFWTRDSRHWFNIRCVRTQYDRPGKSKAALTPVRLEQEVSGAEQRDEPPVTSHIWVMADSSVGTLPSCSLSGADAPGSLRTSANRRWSQRKGSLVSSLPARGEFRGRCSCRTEGKKTSPDLHCSYQ